MENNQDVQPESSPEPTPEPIQETPTQDTQPTSAETLNTEAEKPHEQAIPYERFKEVNDQLKSLKESEDWRGYQVLKETLDKDPKFAEYFTQKVSDFYRPQPQEEQPDPYADYPQEIAEPLRKTQMLENTVQQLLQQNQAQQEQNLKGQYLTEFNKKISEVNIPDHQRSFYEKQVEIEAGKLNPYALKQYDQALVNKAFDNVHKELTGLLRAERGSYQAEKTQDQVPVSSRGAAPMQAQSRPGSTEGRASMVAELLKAGS